MQAPKFWYRSRSWQAVLLSPLGVLYAWATARRQKNARPTQIDIPVICIGNLNVGGTGKTPTTIAIAQMLTSRGIAVHIVSRGYGGSLQAVTQVDPRIHTADETGDEPLLMAAFAPTWVANERVAGARAAQNAGADVILLDDGFQDPSLIKDLSIIVVDASPWIWQRALPACGSIARTCACGFETSGCCYQYRRARGASPVSGTLRRSGGPHRTPDRQLETNRNGHALGRWAISGLCGDWGSRKVFCNTARFGCPIGAYRRAG